MPHGDRANGTSGLSAFAKSVAFVGLPGFIALYLLGVFGTWLPSPLLEIKSAIANHDQTSVRVLRMICKGIWRDAPVMQQECDR